LESQGNCTAIQADSVRPSRTLEQVKALKAPKAQLERLFLAAQRSFLDIINASNKSRSKIFFEYYQCFKLE
jgi:hypothetical protein